MKYIVVVCTVFFSFCNCSHSVNQQPQVTGADSLIQFQPSEVKKQVSKKVFAHLMPWFETKQTNQPIGTWGMHWTMANQNPDVTDANGRRQIASFYYPLTGPYASSDTTIIEYQLLLMKYSGIDGVFIDWPGTIQINDYPKNVQNSEKIISMLAKVGLKFAIVYEDQNVNIAYNSGAITNKIKAAQNDMQYLETNYFSLSSYEKINNAPLLLVFGPQTFMQQADWQQIFSVLHTAPSFYTLWGVSGDAGSTASGEFAWINSDNTVSLNNFYGNNYSGKKIASAYPGFNPFYAKGGWSGPTFVINAYGTNNFAATLSLALKSNAGYIQLPTWNDYGEGTMIEPTVEFQYSLLTNIQQQCGVNYGVNELQMISQLYADRVKYAGNTAIQQKLNQVFYYLVSLQTDKATSLLNEL